MRKIHPSAVSLCFAMAVPATLAAARAEPAVPYEELAKMEAAANAQDAQRVAPGKLIGNPTQDVSPEMQAMVGAPYPPHFQRRPHDPGRMEGAD